MEVSDEAPFETWNLELAGTVSCNGCTGRLAHNWLDRFDVVHPLGSTMDGRRRRRNAERRCVPPGSAEDGRSDQARGIAVDIRRVGVMHQVDSLSCSTRLRAVLGSNSPLSLYTQWAFAVIYIVYRCIIISAFRVNLAIAGSILAEDHRQSGCMKGLGDFLQFPRPS